MSGEQQKLAGNIRRARAAARDSVRRKHREHATMRAQRMESEYVARYGDQVSSEDTRTPTQRWIEWLRWGIDR
jgi:hypothetical protein